MNQQRFVITATLEKTLFFLCTNLHKNIYFAINCHQGVLNNIYWQTMFLHDRFGSVWYIVVASLTHTALPSTIFTWSALYYPVFLLEYLVKREPLQAGISRGALFSLSLSPSFSLYIILSLFLSLIPFELLTYCSTITSVINSLSEWVIL